MGKRFSTRVREARERADLSQAKFGEMFGVKAATISHWENGTSKPWDERYKKVLAWLIKTESAYRRHSGSREEYAGERKSRAETPFPAHGPDAVQMHNDTPVTNKGIALQRDVLVTDLVDVPLSSASHSAQPNQGWKLEQVTVSRGKHFTVSAQWTEAEIEDYLAQNWNHVDFGQVGELVLVGRQVRLKTTTREKVDLVARTTDGRWIAIEIKCGEASDSALTQLLSYMSDLSFSLQLQAERVVGILVAPGFGEKVLNAAADNSRVRLLRFFHEA